MELLVCLLPLELVKLFRIDLVRSRKCGSLFEEIAMNSTFREVEVLWLLCCFSILLEVWMVRNNRIFRGLEGLHKIFGKAKGLKPICGRLLLGFFKLSA